MGFILEALLGLPFAPAMALGTGLFVFYVALGGMLAVIWTNIAQFAFMWVGLLIILPAAYAAAGNWTTALERAARRRHSVVDPGFLHHGGMDRPDALSGAVGLRDSPGRAGTDCRLRLDSRAHAVHAALTSGGAGTIFWPSGRRGHGCSTDASRIA